MTEQVIPKTWYDVSRRKRHVLDILTIEDESQRIVVSRHWSTKHKNWIYHAEPIEDVLFQIRIIGGEFDA